MPQTAKIGAQATKRGSIRKGNIGFARSRTVKWQDHIERDPKVMTGKPVIKGTRITVELILEMLGNGASEQDILSSYPHLESVHIRAAQAYAAAALSTDEIVFLDEHAA